MRISSCSLKSKPSIKAVDSADDAAGKVWSQYEADAKADLPSEARLQGHLRAADLEARGCTMLVRRVPREILMAKVMKGESEWTRPYKAMFHAASRRLGEPQLLECLIQLTRRWSVDCMHHVGRKKRFFLKPKHFIRTLPDAASLSPGQLELGPPMQELLPLPLIWPPVPQEPFPSLE